MQRKSAPPRKAPSVTRSSAPECDSSILFCPKPATPPRPQGQPLTVFEGCEHYPSLLCAADDNALFDELQLGIPWQQMNWGETGRPLPRLICHGTAKLVSQSPALQQLWMFVEVSDACMPALCLNALSPCPTHTLPCSATHALQRSAMQRNAMRRNLPASRQEWPVRRGIVYMVD